MEKYVRIVTNIIRKMHHSNRLVLGPYDLTPDQLIRGIENHINGSYGLMSDVLNGFKDGPKNQMVMIDRSDLFSVFNTSKGILAAHTLFGDSIHANINEVDFPMYDDVSLFGMLSSITRQISENPNDASIDPLISNLERLMNAAVDSPSAVLPIILSAVGDNSITHLNTSELSLLGESESSLRYINITNAALVLSFYIPLLKVMGLDTELITNSCVSTLYPLEYTSVKDSVKKIEPQIAIASKLLTYILDNLQAHIPSVNDVIVRNSKSLGTLTLKLLKRNKISSNFVASGTAMTTVNVDLEEIHDLAAGMIILDTSPMDSGLLTTLGNNIKDNIFRILSESDGYSRYISDILLEIKPRKPIADFEAVHIDIIPKEGKGRPFEIIVMDKYAYHLSLFGQNSGHWRYDANRSRDAINVTIYNNKNNPDIDRVKSFVNRFSSRAINFVWDFTNKRINGLK